MDGSADFIPKRNSILHLKRRGQSRVHEESAGSQYRREQAHLEWLRRRRVATERKFKAHMEGASPEKHEQERIRADLEQGMQAKAFQRQLEEDEARRDPGPGFVYPGHGRSPTRRQEANSGPSPEEIRREEALQVMLDNQRLAEFRAQRKAMEKLEATQLELRLNQEEDIFWRRPRTLL